MAKKERGSQKDYLVEKHRQGGGGPSGENGRQQKENIQGYLGELQKLGILPEAIRTLTESTYSAVMYSAIDVPEPRNNVLVWKISLSTKKQNADKRNRLLDAYVDADTGKIYEFYARVDFSSWDDVDADEIVETWAEYMGLGKPREYEEVNPLSETTPYFKKFSFSGMEEGNTIVTVGFYEGINELFLKISR